MRRTQFLADQETKVPGRAATLIRTSLLTFAAAAVAMTSAVSPASAKHCVEWQWFTQKPAVCKRWVADPHFPKNDNGKKHPCNVGQKC
jgi:hypothetical protein